MKILFLLLILNSTFLVTSMMQIAFSQEKFIEFENNNYDIKIEYPQSWNIREGDIEPGDFKTEIVILEPQGEFGISRSDDYNCGDVCIALFIDNTPRESNLAIETYVDQTINSLKDDLDKFEVIYYDTTNTKVDDHQAYKLVYEEENKDKKYITIQRGVIFDNQVYIVEYKAMEEYYEQYLPLAEEIIESLKLPEK
jgi:eukaryotic-like serine/threonine-protein kinase